MSDVVAEDRLLTILEVSERCNASPSWVRKAIKLGLLSYVDLSLEHDPKRREPRIKETVVEAFLKNRERQEPPARRAWERMAGKGRGSNVGRI